MFKKRWLFLMLAGTFLLTQAHAQNVQPRLHVLDNGLKLILVKRTGDPSVACGMAFKVGSVNERPGITGISHLFEHMMFKGTTTIGTKDYNADKKIMAQQDSMKALLRQEESKMRTMERLGQIDDMSKRENLTPRYRELEKVFDDLIKQQREIIIKDELDRIYSKNGGAGLNAFTGEDVTFYIINVPANKLELYMWLESDRLLNPVFREFYSERDVVYEERRLRVESTPTGKYDEQFESLFWQSSPYTWPVIGWPSDLRAITKEQADEYFATYYAPNNCIVVMVGDLDYDEVIKMAARYFGRISRGKNEPPEVITTEVPQLAEKRMYAEAETNPEVRIWYHGVAHDHADEPALDVLTSILSGKTGRLYKKLVLEKQIANNVSAGVETRKYAGIIRLSGVVKDEHKPEEVEQAIYDEITKLQEEPAGAYELQKVKNQEAAGSFRRLQSNFFLMLQLGIYEVNGDWNYINTYPPKVQAITASDVQRVAKKYFTRENRNVIIYTRKKSAAPEDPEIAGLSEQGKQMVNMMTARLQQTNDAAQLQQMISMMESRISEAPEDQRKAVEIVVKKAKERLAELESRK
ncbi:insulinase family protein [candidate division KSB1 bacterium]|nr:insulinase family protein [candidate division KSB1 bacterium]